MVRPSAVIVFAGLLASQVIAAIARDLSFTSDEGSISPSGFGTGRWYCWPPVRRNG